MRGKILGNRYRIQNRIGEGGMAYVYVAIDEKLNRKVAVKILHKHMADNPEIRQRFYYEARAISALDHRNILKIYDFSGENSDELWIVTEILKGVNLGEYVRTFPGKWLHPVVATCIVEEILAALAAAHSQNIIHRDIKPENIMVLDAGKIKLMDFGIAKNMQANSMTITGAFMGSPSYMSPEQIRGKSIDHRSDLYSLGVLFYEIITGQLPFVGASTHDVVMKICEGKFSEPKHLVPNLPEQLNKIILKGMGKHFSHRYQDAHLFAKDTRSFLAANGFEESHIELERYFTDTEKFIGRLKKLTFTNAGNTTTKVIANNQLSLHQKTTKNQQALTQMLSTPAQNAAGFAAPNHAATTGKQSLPSWQTTRKDPLLPRATALKHLTRKTPPPGLRVTPHGIAIATQNIWTPGVGRRRIRPRYPKRSRMAQPIIGVYTQYRIDNFAKLMGIVLVAAIITLSIVGFWQAQTRLAPASTRTSAKENPQPSVQLKNTLPMGFTNILPPKQPLKRNTFEKKSVQTIENLRTIKKEPSQNAVATAKPNSKPTVPVATAKPLAVVNPSTLNKPANILLSAEPAAEIFIDGKKWGTTLDQTINSGWLKLSAGEHVLELRRKGFKTYVDTLSLKAGERRDLGKIDLRIQNRARVRFAANERPTRVNIESIDGQTKKAFVLNGQPSAEFLNWGRYRVRLEHGGKIINRTIDINAQTPELIVDADFSLIP